MSLALYMDVHVPFAITQGMRRRGIDVLTAQEDAADTLDDPQFLIRAQELNRIVFSFDQDFSQIVAQWQTTGRSFAGVIVLRKWDMSLRQCLDELELICKAYEPVDIHNRLEYLPLS